MAISQNLGYAAVTALDYDAHRAGVAQCAELLRRAILTLRALPDRDRPRDLRNGWPAVVRDWHGYNNEDLPPPRFKPEPRDVQVYLDVLGWITWLEQQNDGKRDAKVIVARAFGFSSRQIAERFGRDPRTVQRWYDGAVTRVYAAFTAEVLLLASPARPDRPQRSARCHPAA